MTVPMLYAQATPLRVGTSADYAPFSMRDTTGALSGFDIAVAGRLAADLGRTAQFVSFRWPGLQAQLDDGAFDIVMSGVTVRADRAVHGAFSRPYAVSGAVVVIHKGHYHVRPTLTDLDRPEIRIAVNAGGHLEQVARAQFSRARVTPVRDNVTLPALLRSGTADAVVSEEFEARTWPGAEFEIIGPFTRDWKAYLVPRDAAGLVQQITEWLVARENDGWLNEQRRVWLRDQTWTPAHATFEALAAALDLRLRLMPLVGAAKHRAHVPIEDPAQEQRVIERAESAAVTAGLNRDDVAGLFRVQIEIAKAVEREGAPKESADAAGAEESLADLRAAIARTSEAELSELARAQPWIGDARRRAELDATIRQSLSCPGVSAAMKTQLLEAIHRVRRGGS